MGPVHATGGGRGSVPEPEGRSGHSADLAPGCPADRGACVREFSGLLPAGEPEGPPGAIGTGSDSEIGAGEAGPDADGGCPRADE